MLEEGVPIDNIIAIGGIARKSSFVMRTMADVMGMPIRVLDSDQLSVIGNKIYVRIYDTPNSHVCQPCSTLEHLPDEPGAVPGVPGG